MQFGSEFLEWDSSVARFLVELPFGYGVAVGVEKFQRPFGVERFAFILPVLAGCVGDCREQSVLGEVLPHPSQ